MTTADRPATMCEALKLKRKPIFTKYSEQIEELYARDLLPDVHEPAVAATVQPA